MTQTPTTPSRRPRVSSAAVLIGAGLISSAMLSFSMNGTLAAFTAQITNTTDSAATGYIAMKETSGATVCNSNDGTVASVGANAATCATINKYGGTGTQLVPGGALNSTSITITNTGTIAANGFTLTPGACSQAAFGTAQGGATDVCTKINVTITSGSTTVYSGTAAAMTTTNILGKLGSSSVAPGASVPFTITVGLDASANNTYQGYQVAQSLAWTFTS